VSPLERLGAKVRDGDCETYPDWLYCALLLSAGHSLMKQAELEGISERYAAFAADEARGSSARYEKLALAVASSDDLLKFIATLPRIAIERSKEREG
jgi:hypothetical protein